MKNCLILILSIVCLTSAKTQGQFMVYQDEKGQIFTTTDNYATGRQYATTASHIQVTFLESPFYTFPVWQQGTIQLDKSGRKVSCQLAYNLVSNEVLCRFEGDSTVKIVTPEYFTVNTTEFVRLQHNLAGLDYRTYFSLLHNGPTKLWMSLSSQLVDLNSAEVLKSRAYRDLNIQGIYRIKPMYYIQQRNGELSTIRLTKKSLLEALPGQSAAMNAKIPNKPMTPDEVVNALNYYDSLLDEVKENARNLSGNETFKELLQHKITYPAKAAFQGIYGRVYAGFDIDSLGKVKNIVFLSPENIGFGFTDAVRKSLETLPDISPQFRGHYALPVAFTYTNVKEKTGPNMPVNRLPDNRFKNRTVLEEVVVPLEVNKPVLTSREVWGYYP